MSVEKPYCPLKVAFKGKETIETRCTNWCAWRDGKFGCAILVISQVLALALVKQK